MDWSTLFKDKNGNVSSKRIFGFVMLVMSLTWGFTGSLVGNPMMVDFAKWILGGGVMSLVAGVAERKE